MSGKYDYGRELMADGSLSWTRDRIVAQLVSREYAFDVRHRDARSLKGLLGTAVVLANKSVPAGWAKSDHLVFKEVSGKPDDEAVAMIFRRDSKEAARSTLIAYLDSFDRFPMRLNGGDILVDMPAPGFFRF